MALLLLSGRNAHARGIKDQRFVFLLVAGSATLHTSPISPMSSIGNNVIACIRARLCNNLLVTKPTAQEITEVYSQTPGDCGLRRLIVLMHTTEVGGEGLLSAEEGARGWIGDIPAEFARDLIVRFMLDDSGWVTGFWGQDWVVEWVKDDEAGYQVDNQDLGKQAAQ